MDVLNLLVPYYIISSHKKAKLVVWDYTIRNCNGLHLKNPSISVTCAYVHEGEYIFCYSKWKYKKNLRISAKWEWELANRVQGDFE
jgi:hypothetical protein